MKLFRFLFPLVLLAGPVWGQVVVYKSGITTNRISEDLTFGTGRELLFESGATLDVDSGVTLDFGDPAAWRTALGVQVVLTEGAFVDGDKTKLDGIEALADVTDATNVEAAGAVMESDTSTASMSFVVDEDNMASDSATKVPSQQSVKAYADTKVALAGIDTLDELDDIITDADISNVTQDHGGVVVGATETVDFSTGKHHQLLLDQAATVTVTGSSTSGVTAWGQIDLIQDAGGGNAVTLSPVPDNGQPYINEAVDAVTTLYLMSTDAWTTMRVLNPRDIKHDAIILACSDLTTSLSGTPTSVAYYDFRSAYVVTSVRATLLGASTSGAVTVDINVGGTTILSTKLTIDQDETSSATAATPAVISDTSFAANGRLTVDIDGAGTSAEGLIVEVDGYYP